MSNNMKGVLVVVCIAAVAGGVYLHFNKGKISYAKVIVKLGGAANYPALLTMQEGYLRSWAKALKKAKNSFSYNDEDYSTVGGKKIANV